LIGDFHSFLFKAKDSALAVRFADIGKDELDSRDVLATEFIDLSQVSRSERLEFSAPTRVRDHDLQDSILKLNGAGSLGNGTATG